MSHSPTLGISCYQPEVLRGGAFENPDDRSATHRYGDTISYFCQLGYEWDPDSGPLTRTCTATKFWSGRKPVCKRESRNDVIADSSLI